MKKIETEELHRKLEKNMVTLVDVLKSEDYERLHIKRAVNIPLETIDDSTKERFLRDEPIVVYCTDYQCTASPKAAEKLEELGFRNVYHYQGGKKEWQEAGLPMEGKEIEAEQYKQSGP